VPQHKNGEFVKLVQPVNSKQLDLESQPEPRVILPLQPKIAPRVIRTLFFSLLPQGQTLLIVNGSWCNPTHPNFDLTMPIILKIVEYCDSIVPVSYRRYATLVPCRKRGGMRFTFNGFQYFNLVLTFNMAGAGDIVKASVKGSRTGWMSMSKN
ncbi:hypothetical protein Gogos_005412, partial [Gossypium gossypioides]|nr:hypothetical protein [Gossypium gossypioides]